MKKQEQNKGKRLALFDFDGTLTYGDSFVAFIKFVVGNWSYYRGLAKLFPVLTGYKLGLTPNYEAKERVLTWFFRNWDVEHFNKVAAEFSVEKLPQLIRPRGRELIEWHREREHAILIVSASPENYLHPWAEKIEVQAIGTCLETAEGKLTGRLEGANCYGVEKVKRVREVLDPEEFLEVYAYGDSRGDHEMLKLAHFPFYKKIK